MVIQIRRRFTALQRNTLEGARVGYCAVKIDALSVLQGYIRQVRVNKDMDPVMKIVSGKNLVIALLYRLRFVVVPDCKYVTQRQSPLILTDLSISACFQGIKINHRLC